MDPLALLTVAGPVLAAVIGGWFAYAAGKAKAGVDAQSAVQSGFQMLVKQLQEERVELTRIVDKQIDEITELRGEVRVLSRHVNSLEKVIRELGGEPPQLPNR